MFHHIINCMEKIAPHIIVITGDLVNNPWERNFLTLKNNVDKIKKNDKLPHNLHILVIPGNHDYFMFGNKFFNFYNRKKLYKKHESSYLYPYEDYFDNLISILVCFKIALFPLNSNSSNLSFGFAQGRIKNPLPILQEFSRYFGKISTAENINYNSVLKIALIHHHPLPIATSAKEESIERFLVLINSYQFLESCRISGINIILHGHKHMSNLMNYTFFGDEKKSVTISSCSSSGKSEKDRREIKSIEISRSGTTNFQSYFSRQHDNEFADKDKPHETKYYGDIRKNKNKTCCLLQAINKCPVLNIKNKTKIISILDDGSAFVTISIANIKWKSDIGYKDKIIQERIRSDMGRIAGGLYSFSRCPITDEGPEQNWQNPLLKRGVLANPEKEESFIKRFSPTNPASGSDEDCFKLNYYSSSSFTLTKRGHQERYKNWDQDRPRQEYASISIDYPTDSIELIVKFPQGFYPSVKGIYVEASEKEDLSKGSNLKTLYGKMPVHDEETKFINFKGALRSRPEVDAIAVFIKYPQPEIEYILRWNLSEDDYRELKIGSDQKLKYQCIKLSESFCMEKNRQKVDLLYIDLVNFLKSEIFIDGKISIILFAYNFDKKHLKVTRCDKHFYERICGNLAIGRGPEGKAFKLRQAVFWEKDCGIYYAQYKFPAYPVEEIIKDLRPVKVFAMPLIFPAYISESGDVGDDEQYICPAWGCLSVVSEVENSFKQLSGIDYDAEKAKVLGQIFRKINKKISELVGKSFHEIF